MKGKKQGIIRESNEERKIILDWHKQEKRDTFSEKRKEFTDTEEHS